MIIRKTVVTYYIQFILLYVCLLACSIAIVGRGGNQELLYGQADSVRELSIFEIIIFIFYQYILNFPLGIFNWFSDRYLYTTYYFIIPNALTIAWALSTFLPYKKKTINKIMLYVIIPFGILTFTLVSYIFVKSMLGGE